MAQKAKKAKKGTGQPDWMAGQGFVFYCGSKPGKTDVPRQDVEEIVDAAVTRFGFGHMVYGGGKSGCMGFAHDRASSCGLIVEGITIPFFAKAQGRGDTEEIWAKHFKHRLQRFRERSVLGYAGWGGIGSLHEIFEHGHSKNGAVNPLILNNRDGFYQPTVQMLKAMAKQELDDKIVNQRIYHGKGAEKVIGITADLNSRKQTADKRKASHNYWDFIEDLDHAVVVRPGPLVVLEHVFERAVLSDIAGTVNNLKPSLERPYPPAAFKDETVHLPGGKIKPFIFVGDHYRYLKEQFENSIDQGFMLDDRMRLLVFADSEDEAHEISTDRGLCPEGGLVLRGKHAEADPGAVSPRAG